MQVGALVLAVWCAGGAAALAAQETTAQSGPRGRPAAPLFASHEPLVLTLETDLRALLRDRSEDAEDRSATLTYADPAGAPVAIEIGVRTRGNFRLRPGTCRFPPLRFNFPKKQVEHTVFGGQDKVKVVTHCQARDEYQQYLLHEYLVYRTYNQLTDLSFRVRLARVTYRDSAGHEDSVTRYAFFVEDEDAMAQRVGMAIDDTLGVHPATTQFEQTGILDVFQYMIGNTDWSVWGLHNIKLLADSGRVLYPVPYDFDWSGLVEARYARPDSRLQIRTVRDRLFRGFCRSPEEFAQAFAPFNASREAVMALYRDQEGLDPKRLAATLEYLDDFYATINDPGRVDREFLKKCR